MCSVLIFIKRILVTYRVNSDSRVCLRRCWLTHLTSHTQKLPLKWRENARRYYPLRHHRSRVSWKWRRWNRNSPRKLTASRYTSLWFDESVVWNLLTIRMSTMETETCTQSRRERQKGWTKMPRVLNSVHNRNSSAINTPTRDWLGWRREWTGGQRRIVWKKGSPPRLHVDYLNRIR